MKKLRIRGVEPQDLKAGSVYFCVVQPTHDGDTLIVEKPAQLEFVDDETGDVTPVEFVS